MQPRVLAVLCLRNEGAFLLEWLAHHRAVGFTDFLVFSNDCEDGTDAMLDRLQDIGWLTHVRNDDAGSAGPQWAALKAADQHGALARTDWVMCIDIDEFVNIHTGDRTLAALLRALPEATAITLTWRLFGNAGVVRHADVPVTQTFRRAAPADLIWPWRARMFKTLYRADGTYTRMGVHRPRDLDETRPPPCWFDGAGQRMPDRYHRTGLFSASPVSPISLVQLNHYALGAMESYILKCDRGRANRAASAFDMGYWVDRNFCDAADDSITAFAAQSAPVLAALHADAVLEDLHARALAWRQDRFRSLMAQEDWRALFGRLLMTPPSRVLPRDTAQMIQRFGQP